VNTFKLLQKDILFKHHSQKNKIPSELKYVLIDIIEKEKSPNPLKLWKKQYSRTILPLIKKCNICLFANNISKKGQ